MDHIIAKLNELADVRAASDMTRREYEARRAEILAAVQAELDALEAEFQPLLESAARRQEALEAEVRSDVLELGGSVRGAHVHAVFARGRVSWDTRRLDRYAEEHPEVLAFRREGAPIVSLRWDRELRTGAAERGEGQA
jgi:hypothetical protein